jgi:hypothetical protein
MTPLITDFQYHIGNLSYCDKARKVDKSKQIEKEEVRLPVHK